MDTIDEMIVVFFMGLIVYWLFLSVRILLDCIEKWLIWVGVIDKDDDDVE